MIKCSQEKCDAPATWEYYWPGQGGVTYGCEEHTQGAVNVGRVLGFHIHPRRLDPPLDAP